MQWIAPSEKEAANHALEKRLSEATDQLRANSGLNAQPYSGPVLDLIFLRLAEVRLAKKRSTLEKKEKGSRGSRVEAPAAYHADGIIFLAPDARFGFLLSLLEGAKPTSRFQSTLPKQLLPRLVSGQAPLNLSAIHEAAKRTVPVPQLYQTDFARERPPLRAAEETLRYGAGKRRK